MGSVLITGEKLVSFMMSSKIRKEWFDMSTSNKLSIDQQSYVRGELMLLGRPMIDGISDVIEPVELGKLEISPISITGMYRGKLPWWYYGMKEK